MTARTVSAYLAAGLMLAAVPGRAASEHVLASLDIGTGSSPAGALVRDAAGDLFGMATYGGTYNGGTIYELPARGSLRNLYSFVIFAKDSPWQPYGDLLIGADGALYGTTSLGGKHSCGTVFRFTPGAPPVVLYSFRVHGKDGCNPLAGLIADAQGNLYGTTLLGGRYGSGTVFRVAPDGTETVLWSLGRGNDAALPQAKLTMDAAGNLYGTTFNGGTSQNGAVFKLTPAGQESVLYSFSGGADGANPTAPILVDAQGNVFGTTFQGGQDGVGTVFSIAPGGSETVLHSFTLKKSDGAYPGGGLTAGPDGTLYGTTENGGAHATGMVFALAADGTETVLTSFGGKYNASGPAATLITDPAGHLLGTGFGGRFGNRTGALFTVTP